jgi:hypothetical protein
MFEEEIFLSGFEGGDNQFSKEVSLFFVNCVQSYCSKPVSQMPILMSIACLKEPRYLEQRGVVEQVGSGYNFIAVLRKNNESSLGWLCVPASSYGYC